MVDIEKLAEEVYNIMDARDMVFDDVIDLVCPDSDVRNQVTDLLEKEYGIY